MRGKILFLLLLFSTIPLGIAPKTPVSAQNFSEEIQLPFNTPTQVALTTDYSYRDFNFTVSKYMNITVKVECTENITVNT